MENLLVIFGPLTVRHPGRKTDPSANRQRRDIDPSDEAEEHNHL